MIIVVVVVVAVVIVGPDSHKQWQVARWVVQLGGRQARRPLDEQVVVVGGSGDDDEDDDDVEVDTDNNMRII